MAVTAALLPLALNNVVLMHVIAIAPLRLRMLRRLWLAIWLPR